MSRKVACPVVVGLQQMGQRFLGQLGVAAQGLNDPIDRDRLFFFVPNIVIGDVGHAGVGDLGFGGQERFGAGGHADDVHAPFAVGVRFAFAAKAWSFDGDKGAALVHVAADGAGASDDGLAEFWRKRVGHADVGYQPIGKKGVLAQPFGVVVDLVWDDDVAWGVCFLQRAAGADGDDVFDAERFEDVDVGAVGDFGGGEGVPTAVAGQKGDSTAV